MTKNSERDAAIDRLREWIKPGDTIYCILRNRAASGMSRTISFKGIQCCKDGKLDVGDYSYNIHKALGYRWSDRHEGVTVGGCGMDMGFAVVRELSRTLYPGSDKPLVHYWL